MGTALATGTLVSGRYQLVARLGEGTFGDVWRAEDTNLGRLVAIKFLRETFLHEPATVARFDGEAAALARLTHPNVVAVFDRGAWNGEPYLVTELVVGESLQGWIATQKQAGGVPGLAAVRHIFDQICAGVEAAHDVRAPGPIVHRDLKPGNVMLARDKRGNPLAKVLDFGIARFGDRHLTMSGLPMGTPIYMPPEQALGNMDEVGPWSDVFSLGVILVEMLTCRQLAPGDELWWLAVKVGVDVGATLRGLRGDVPVEVWRVAEKSLQAVPSARFADAGELRVAIAAAWGSAGPDATRSTSLARLVPRWKAPSPYAIAAGVGLLAGVVLSVVAVGARKGHRRAPGAVGPSTSARSALPPPQGTCPEGMVRLPGGTFMMGSPPGEGYDDERPEHPETVRTFCLDRTEVTVAAYRACAAAGACTDPDAGPRCNWSAAGRDDHPINCVDWSQARAYCAFLGKRLPAEREWEYAARGPEGRVYPWGNTPPSDQLCWDGEGSDLGKGKRLGTCAVGSHGAGATPLGLHDLAGNVWEWTEDDYCPYLGRGCAEGARVNRGGAWSYGYASDMRAANRHRYPASSRSYGVGLRCALGG